MKEDYSIEWGQIALWYLKYSLVKRKIGPDSPESRQEAEEIEMMTGISRLELARLFNAELRLNTGKSFVRKRAKEIAVAWCWANKLRAINGLHLSKEKERELIALGARRIGVDPDEALAFNLYLEIYWWMQEL